MCVCVLNEMVDILKQIALVDLVFVLPPQVPTPILLCLNCLGGGLVWY